jgi:hypothetical protein
VDYFVDAVVDELDPLDKFLEAVQLLGDPQDQEVSEAAWPNMVDLSEYPAPMFEGGHTYSCECLETIDEEGATWLATLWLMQDMPWMAFCSDWMMQTLNPRHPFGPMPLQERSEHVIHSARMFLSVNLQPTLGQF